MNSALAGVRGGSVDPAVYPAILGRRDSPAMTVWLLWRLWAPRGIRTMMGLQ